MVKFSKWGKVSKENVQIRICIISTFIFYTILHNKHKCVDEIDNSNIIINEAVLNSNSPQVFVLKREEISRPITVKVNYDESLCRFNQF